MEGAPLPNSANAGVWATGAAVISEGAITVGGT